MKRLLLLLPLLMTPAAQAMDYVKCEAMQKAIERTRESRSLIYDTVSSQHLSSIKEEICGPQPNVLSFSSSSDPLAYSQASLAWTICESNNYSEISSKLHSLIDADPDYKKATARIERVQADYQAEGCY